MSDEKTAKTPVSRARRRSKPRGAAGPVEAQRVLRRLTRELESARAELEARNEQLRLTNRRWEASRRAYLELFETAAVALVTLQKDGRVENANTAAQQLFKLSLENLRGCDFSWFVAAEDQQFYFSRLNRIGAGNPVPPSELRLKSGDGKEVHALVRASPDVDPEGRPDHWRLTIVDIGNQKRLERSLRESQEQLALATDAAGIGIWHYVPLTHRSHWNERLYRLLGLPPGPGWEDGDRLFDFIHAEDRTGVLEGFGSFLKTTGRFDLEFRIVRAGDGRVRWLRARGTVRRDPSGRVLGVHGVSYDITAKKTFQIAMEESRERFLSILEHSRDIAYRWNLRNGSFDYLSPVVETVTGFSPAVQDRLTEDELLALVHPHDRARVLSTQKEAYPSGGGMLHVRLRRKAGGYVWIEDAFTIQTDAAGQPLYRIGMARDIQQQKRTEKALSEQRRSLADKVLELERINEELTQYAHVVSHDLKAPLRAVRNYADFLYEDLAGSLSGEQRKYLLGIQKALDQGDALVEDLLIYARVGKSQLETENIALAALVREVRAGIDPQGEARIVLRAGCPYLRCDRTLLLQILRNLVANGLKFNTGKVKRIDIGWQAREDGGGELFVRDNGIGIDRQYHRQIFRIFQRLHSPAEYEGTGIGLAIVAKAAYRLGGSMRLESRPGEGSTFYLRLPPGTALSRREAGPRRRKSRPCANDKKKSQLQGRSP